MSQAGSRCAWTCRAHVVYVYSHDLLQGWKKLCYIVMLTCCTTVSAWFGGVGSSWMLMDRAVLWGYNSSQLQHAHRKALAPTLASWCSFAAVWQLSTHPHSLLENPTPSLPTKQTHWRPNTGWKGWSSQVLITPKQRSTTRSQRKHSLYRHFNDTDSLDKLNEY